MTWQKNLNLRTKLNSFYSFPNFIRRSKLYIPSLKHRNLNKNTGYQGHISRITIFVKMPLSKMEKRLLLNSVFFHRFSNFSTVKSLWFLAEKKLTKNRVDNFEKHQNITFKTYSLKKLQQLAFLREETLFFSKTQQFLQKSQKMSVLRKIIFNVAVCGKFATIWFKKITFRNAEEHRWRWTQLVKVGYNKRTLLNKQTCS